MHFYPFPEPFPFLLEKKISDLIFALNCLTKHLRYNTYGHETCCSYLSSMKHLYFHG